MKKERLTESRKTFGSAPKNSIYVLFAACSNQYEFTWSITR